MFFNAEVSTIRLRYVLADNDVGEPKLLWSHGNSPAITCRLGNLFDWTRSAMLRLCNLFGNILDRDDAIDSDVTQWHNVPFLQLDAQKTSSDHTSSECYLKWMGAGH